MGGEDWQIAKVEPAFPAGPKKLSSKTHMVPHLAFVRRPTSDLDMQLAASYQYDTTNTKTRKTLPSLSDSIEMAAPVRATPDYASSR